MDQPLNILKKFTLPFVVFITGGCVLIIEIIAIRILSPYFGNTIYTVSSVISVVLAALSLGYYTGGKLADKNGQEKLFYILILGSGIVTILLHLLGVIFLPTFGYQLSIIQGPLIFSLILFFGQNFLLGMLSPFAVLLEKTRSQQLGVGGASGQIFFWSTLGSIAGSLLAGFFLIPNFGIDRIMVGVGVVLIILGLAGTIKASFWPKFLLLMAIACLSPFLLNSISLPQKVVYSTDSIYQKITIYDGLFGQAPTRFLIQDRNSSAAQFLHADELVYEYTKYYSLYQLFNLHPTQTLVIGGGAYSVPKVLLKELPLANVDVAEIDPIIFDLGKQYFNVPNDQRLKNFAQDGRRFLHDSAKTYDVIFSDAYASFYSTPEHLTTQEFFTMAKEKLAPNGVFIANVVGTLSKKPQSYVLSEMNTFKSIFNNSYFFAVRGLDVAKPQNLIFVGYNGKDTINFKSPEVAKNKNPLIRGLAQRLIHPETFEVSSHPILTDNFAPVDYLISREFNNL